MSVHKRYKIYKCLVPYTLDLIGKGVLFVDGINKAVDVPETGGHGRIIFGGFDDDSGDSFVLVDMNYDLMDTTEKLDIETCIEGLKWIVRDVLAKEEAKRSGQYVRLLDIRVESGIKDKLAAPEDQASLEHAFTLKILEYLLFEEYVEKRRTQNGYWKITDEGLSEHQIDATQEWDLDTCIHGLAEIVLDVLVETGHTGDYMQLKDIADKSGIEDKLIAVEDMPAFKNAFTSTLLMYLLREKRVHKSRIRAGHWKITDEEFQKHRA